MTRTPMPSPNGTNRAGLYLTPGSRAAVAYDAMPGEEDAPGKKSNDVATALALLREYLDADDLKRVGDMLGVNVDTAGMDRRRGAFGGANDRKPTVTPSPVRYDTSTFPNAGRLKG